MTVAVAPASCRVADSPGWRPAWNRSAEPRAARWGEGGTEITVHLPLAIASGVVELTEREQEVLALVAEGLSNQAIAQRLVINERTVETHTARIFTKFGLSQSPEIHRRVMAVLAYLRS
jgi:DNA-binding NarL/FixJ family response regulator